MEGPVVFSWTTFLLFVLLKSSSAQNEHVYLPANSTIRLKPDSSGPFTKIRWKHERNLVAVWGYDDLEYYGMFEGHTTLNTTTGGLVIENTTEAFLGLYTVELNGQVQAKGYKVELMKKVPKPEITVRPLNCSSEMKTCTLVCLHDETPAFGPLSYSWREDDGDWEDGDMDKIIINDEINKWVKNFTCRVRNPISEAESDAYDNPVLHKPIWPTALYLTLKALVVMTFLGLSGYFMWRKREILRKLVCPHQDREKTVKHEGPCTEHVL